MLLFITASAALAGSSACPATPDHIFEACDGCRPLHEEIKNRFPDLQSDVVAEAATCFDAELDASVESVEAANVTAKACITRKKNLDPKLRDFLVSYLSDAVESDALAELDRQWLQCRLTINKGGSPNQCVSFRESGLQAKGNKKLKLSLAADNRCKRPVDCEVRAEVTRTALYAGKEYSETKASKPANFELAAQGSARADFTIKWTTNRKALVVRATDRTTVDTPGHICTFADQ